MSDHARVIWPGLRADLKRRGLRTTGTGKPGVLRVVNAIGRCVYMGTPAEIDHWLTAIKEVAW